MVKAIAHRDKSKVQPCGMTALNMLGLSTQVPTKYTYLTSGSSRKLKLGDRLIELKRSVPKNFVFKTTLGALLMQALKSLGEKNISKLEIVQIRKLIDNEKRINHYRVVGDSGMSNKQKKAFQLLEKGQDIEILSETEFLSRI